MARTTLERPSSGDGARLTSPSSSRLATSRVMVEGTTPSMAASSPNRSRPRASIEARADNWAEVIPLDALSWRVSRTRRARITRSRVRPRTVPSPCADSARS